MFDSYCRGALDQLPGVHLFSKIRADFEHVWISELQIDSHKMLYFHQFVRKFQLSLPSSQFKLRLAKSEALINFLAEITYASEKVSTTSRITHF